MNNKDPQLSDCMKMDGTLQHVYFFLDSDSSINANTKRKDSATSPPAVESAYKVPPFDAKERAAMNQRTIRDVSESSSNSGRSSANSRYVSRITSAAPWKATIYSGGRVVHCITLELSITN